MTDLISQQRQETYGLNRLPAGGATFCAGAGGGGGAGGEGFGVGTDGFFSSGGDTLGIQDAKITTKITTWSIKTH